MSFAEITPKTRSAEAPLSEVVELHVSGLVDKVIGGGPYPEVDNLVSAIEAAAYALAYSLKDADASATLDLAATQASAGAFAAHLNARKMFTHLILNRAAAFVDEDAFEMPVDPKFSVE